MENIIVSFTPEGYAEIATGNGNKIAGTFTVTVDADDVRTFAITPLRTLDEIKTVHDRIREATEGAERAAAVRAAIDPVLDAYGDVDIDRFAIVPKSQKQ